MDYYQIAALFAGGLIVISTIPQIIKTLKLKEVKDVSLHMFVLIFIAQCIWIFYGFHISDLPVILTNGFSMIAIVTNIVLILKYREK